MTFRSSLIFTLFIFSFLSQSAVQSSVLKVSLINVAPFSYLQDGQVTGLNAEIFHSLSQVSGLEIEINLVPLLRAISLVRAGTSDATIMLDTTISDDGKIRKVLLYERAMSIFTLRGHP